MDIQALNAANAYQRAQTATQPVSGEAALAGVVKDFAAVLQNGEATAQAAMVGKADPHALVQALAQTELAVEAAVTVRDRVVQAYQEILRMPV